MEVAGFLQSRFPDQTMLHFPKSLLCYLKYTQYVYTRVISSVLIALSPCCCNSVETQVSVCIFWHVGAISLAFLASASLSWPWLCS